MGQDGSSVVSNIAEIEVFLHQYFCIENAAVFDAAHTFEMQEPRYLLEEVAFDRQGECYLVHFRYCGERHVAIIPATPTTPFTQLSEWQRLRLRQAIQHAVQAR